MRLATIKTGEAVLPAMRLEDGRFLDLRRTVAQPGFPVVVDGKGRDLTLHDFIGLGAEAAEFVQTLAADNAFPAEAVVAASAARVLAPIPRPAKNIFCVGRNYAEHIAEDNASRAKETEIPSVPQFFTKPPTAVVGPDEDVLLDGAATRRLDYEVELAVVIGRRGKNIAAEDAYEYVYGYTIVNDVTARDLQGRHDQWFKGKALDGSAPMGPWIVTADEVPDPHALRIALSVNGQPRQEANTASMIFHIPALIASLSQGLTLEPGDIIATGTPSGVGYAMNPRQWLVDGDEIVCEIEGIGTLANRVRAV